MCAKKYELMYMFKKLHLDKLAHLIDTASKFALFLVSGLKHKKFIKKQTYMKTETCKLYYFEYFCQMLSKLIFIIMRFTISKLVNFCDTV